MRVRIRVRVRVRVRVRCVRVSVLNYIFNKIFESFSMYVVVIVCVRVINIRIQFD